MPRIKFRGSAFEINHTFVDLFSTANDRSPFTTQYFMILSLLQGHGTCFVEGRRYALAPGDVVVLRSNELRHFQFDPNERHERLTIYLSSSALSPLWHLNLPLLQIFIARPAGRNNKLQFGSNTRSTVSSILQDIIRRLSPAASDPPALQEAELHLLLLRLLLHLNHNESPSSPNDNIDPIIGSVCQYIHKNLEKKLTYQHIQQNCHVSRYQLGEVFRSSTGMTLTEYITQKRLIQASELILRGESFSSAARRAGFPNYSYFYKTFCKHRGTSPKQYFNTQEHT